MAMEYSKEANLTISLEGYLIQSYSNQGPHKLVLTMIFDIPGPLKLMNQRRHWSKASIWGEIDFLVT